jgi:hypothetical protein
MFLAVLERLALAMLLIALFVLLTHPPRVAAAGPLAGTGSGYGASARAMPRDCVNQNYLHARREVVPHACNYL